MERSPHVESPTAEIAAVRANERILGVMLVLHGLVHLNGFVLSWRIFLPPGFFEYDDVWPDAATAPGRAVGVAWLLVAVSLVVIGARLATGRSPSAVQLAVPLAVSLTLCVLSSPPALPGAVISGGVLAAMAAVRLRRYRALGSRS